MSDPRTQPSAEIESDAAPDILAELGPFAYGFFALSVSGPLTAEPTLADTRAAQLPAQTDRSAERPAPAEAIVNELDL